jgi:hypothetical protein
MSLKPEVQSPKSSWPRVSMVKSLLALRRVRLEQGQALQPVSFTADGVRLMREEVREVVSFHVECLDLGGHTMVCLGISIQGGRDEKVI